MYLWAVGGTRLKYFELVNFLRCAHANFMSCGKRSYWQLSPDLWLTHLDLAYLFLWTFGIYALNLGMFRTAVVSHTCAMEVESTGSKKGLNVKNAFGPVYFPIFWVTCPEIIVRLLSLNMNATVYGNFLCRGWRNSRQHPSQKLDGLSCLTILWNACAVLEWCLSRWHAQMCFVVCT